MDEDELRALLSAKAPTPAADARAAALSAARQAFREKMQAEAHSGQGSSKEDRLQGEAAKSAAMAQEIKMQKRTDFRKSFVALAVIGVVGSVSWLALNSHQPAVGRFETQALRQTAVDGAAQNSQVAVVAKEVRRDAPAAAPVPAIPEPPVEAKAESFTTTPAEQKMAQALAPMAPPPVAMDSAASNVQPARLKDATVDQAYGGAAAKGNNTGMAQPAPTIMAEMVRKAQPRAPGMSDDTFSNYYQDAGRDKFDTVADNAVKQVVTEPVSTFSTDVDTASYAFMRRSLNEGHLPPKDAVRVEEMVNYFDYHYALPEDRTQPFRPSVTILPDPWNGKNLLMHVGIKGFDLPAETRPKANLVFLIDVSGSMNEPTKLPLAKNALKMLVETLKPDDTVAIVTYAGSAGTALEPTSVNQKNKILQAIDSLGAGGSTAGAEGIQQAYALAESGFVKDGVNRVMLATDGDFNVGVTDQNELKGMIERERGKGIYLSVLGFGMGNYNDATMQALAQNGNGNAAYIDSLNEARRVLVDEAQSTLFPIAKDVKIQIEFNPATVAEYRLVGYETRILAREDFNNDKVDAGDIGAGHAVTAIYEITPRDGAGKLIDDLRYGSEEKAKEIVKGGSEFGFLKIRYKLPNEDVSKLIEQPITVSDQVQDIGKASEDARFAVSVAAFGQMLRGGKYTGAYSYDDVAKLAMGAKGSDEFGQRSEFVNLVRLAKTLQGVKSTGPGDDTDR